MARPGPLSGVQGVALAALALAVLLAHVGALQWLEAQWRQPSVLRPLATPMLTRQIVQKAPAAVAVAPPAAKSQAPRRPAVAHSMPPDATPTSPLTSPPTSPPTPSEPQAAASLDMPSSMPDTATASAGASANPAVAAAATATVATTAAADSQTVTAATTSTSTTASNPTGASATTPNGAPSYLDAWPADTRLTYQLTGNFRGPLTGDARVQWLRPGNRYEVRIDINLSVLASVVMTSQGRLTPHGLEPDVYEEIRGSRRGLKMSESDISLAGGKTVPRPPGVQDTASQFVELAQQFSSGRTALETGKTVSFWMARPGAVDFWTYDITERVTLQTPQLGPVEAFHLKPRPLAVPRGNVTAEMWFAPTLQYLPVRIRINMGDDVYVDLLVEKIEQR